MWPFTTSRYRAEHAEKHTAHTRGLAGLRTDLEALSDYHDNTSDAAESSIKALRDELAAEIRALREEIAGLRAPVAAESAPPKAPRAPRKTAASANGETGTTTEKGTGTP